MIRFTSDSTAKKPGPEVEDNRFDAIRRVATERHRKSDADGAKPRDRQAKDDNEPL